MFEHGRDVMGKMLVELDRGTAARQHLGETVFAIDQFVIPQIVALQFDQVNRNEGDVMIVATGGCLSSRAFFSAASTIDVACASVIDFALARFVGKPADRIPATTTTQNPSLPTSSSLALILPCANSPNRVFRNSR